MAEKQVMKEVKYPFSRAELLELGEELARATDELREIERRKKQVNSDLAAEQKRADGNVFLLAVKLKDRYEYREVACLAVYGVPRAGMKTLKRTDTGEQLEPEPMTAEEMQQGLDFGTTADGAAGTEKPPTQ